MLFPDGRVSQLYIFFFVFQNKELSNETTILVIISWWWHIVNVINLNFLMCWSTNFEETEKKMWETTATNVELFPKIYSNVHLCCSWVSSLRSNILMRVQIPFRSRREYSEDNKSIFECFSQMFEYNPKQIQLKSLALKTNRY